VQILFCKRRKFPKYSFLRISTSDHLEDHIDCNPCTFNAWFAVKVTNGVGTMWCAYAFAALALISLPQAIASRNAVTLVSWVSQTFLQLVLLSVIIVGQNVLAAAADKRSEATYNDADAVLHEAVKIQEHLLAQDQVLSDLVVRLARVESGSGSQP